MLKYCLWSDIKQHKKPIALTWGIRVCASIFELDPFHWKVGYFMHTNIGLFW